MKKKKATKARAGRGIRNLPVKASDAGSVKGGFTSEEHGSLTTGSFLAIDGIPGESADDKHKDWIESRPITQ